jgi:hypothetical protein
MLVFSRLLTHYPRTFLVIGIIVNFMRLRGNALRLTKYTALDDAARTGRPEARMADVIELKVYFWCGASTVWKISIPPRML